MADQSSNVSNEIHTALQEQVTLLASKHVTVSYVLIGVLVFVLILGGVGAYLASKWVDKAMARAEASEKLTAQYKDQYEALNQTYIKTLADNAAARAADEQKFILLAQSIKERNQNTGQKISNIKNPDKTLVQSLADFTDAYRDIQAFSPPWVPTVSVDGTLATFDTAHIQELTANKIEYDTCNANFSDEQKQLDLKSNEVDSLKVDLTNANNTLEALQKTENQCEDTLKKYKSIAKVTKWQRIWRGALKGLEIGGALVAGFEIGKHL